VTRVAFYTRVSSEEQAQEGVSLPEQKERLEQWARLEGWQPVAHYSDEGFSGSSDDRPDFQRLMLDARAGMFDLVAVSMIDRFFRNTRLLLNYIYDLEKLSIGFAAHAEGIDNRKPGIGKIMLALLGAIAEWERDRIGERIKNFRGHLARKGRWSSGRTTFGYRFNKDTKELDIFEAEAEVTRYIFSLYINENLGMIRLAERLNKEQKLTPRWGRRKHNIWTLSAVRHILTHPAYKGGSSEDWKFKTPLIVDTITWHLAQRRLMTNRHFKPAKHRSEYQGIFKCGICGLTLRIGYDHNTRRKYECPGRLRRLHLDGSPRCLLPRFDAEQLEDSLSRQVLSVFSDPKKLAEHIRRTLKEIKHEFAEFEKKANPLYSQMKRIEEDMAIADAKLEMRRIDPTFYKVTVAGLQAQLREARRKCRELDPLELERLLRDRETQEKLWQYFQYRLSAWLYEAIPDKLDGMSGDVNIEYVELLAGSPSELMRKYGMTVFVYPDRMELKGLLPIDIIRQSDSSPGYRSVHYLRFQ